jgi:hypothetical protein
VNALVENVKMMAAHKRTGHQSASHDFRGRPLSADTPVALFVGESVNYSSR